MENVLTQLNVLTMLFIMEFNASAKMAIICLKTSVLLVHLALQIVKEKEITVFALMVLQKLMEFAQDVLKGKFLPKVNVLHFVE